jgi:hypothetical protein
MGFRDPEAMVFTVECGLELPIDRPWLAEERRASLPKPSVIRSQLQLRVLPDDDSALARFTRIPGDEGAWAPASELDRVAAELVHRVQSAALPALDQAVAGERDGVGFRHSHIRYMHVVTPFRPPTQWF